MSPAVRYLITLAGLVLGVIAVAFLGEAIRHVTPVHLHGPLAGAGAILVAGAFLWLVLRATFFKESATRLTSAIAAAIVGLLLFCFYVSGVECMPSGRSGKCQLTDANEDSSRR